MIPQDVPHGLFDETLAKAPQGEAARQALEYYRRTGTFKAGDLSQALGELKRIEVGPDSVPDWSDAKQP